MVDNRGVVNASTLRAEDILPVRSRINWSPICGGAVIALALYLLLTLLGGALGLTISGRVRGETLAVSAAVWAIATIGICLFVGGFITSQFSVGENKLEAVVYGLVMWAVVFGVLMWLMATGVRASFNGIISVATVSDSVSDQDWQNAARSAGVSQAQIDDWKKSIQNSSSDARRTAEDPQNQQAARAAIAATWWAFGGTFLSMVAAALGALVGCGPSIRLFPIVRTSYPQTITVAQ